MRSHAALGLLGAVLILGSGVVATQTYAVASPTEIHLYGFAKADSKWGKVGGDPFDGVFHPTFENNYSLGLDGYEEGSCPPMLVQVRQPNDVLSPVSFDIVFSYKSGDDQVINGLESLKLKSGPPALPRSYSEIMETGDPIEQLVMLPFERNKKTPVEVTGPFKSYKGTTPADGSETLAHYNVYLPAMGQGISYLSFCPRLADEAYAPASGAFFAVYIQQNKEDIRFFRNQVIDGETVE